MAKRRKVNKSEEVRKYLKQHPDVGPTAVSEALKQYKVSPAFVSNIKNKMKNGGQAKKKARPSRRPTANAAAAGASADGIVAAARLIQLCGGVREASVALRTAEKVADVLG